MINILLLLKLLSIVIYWSWHDFTTTHCHCSAINIQRARSSTLQVIQICYKRNWVRSARCTADYETECDDALLKHYTELIALYSLATIFIWPASKNKNITDFNCLLSPLYMYTYINTSSEVKLSNYLYYKTGTSSISNWHIEVSSLKF